MIPYCQKKIPTVIFLIQHPLEHTALQVTHSLTLNFFSCVIEQEMVISVNYFVYFFLFIIDVTVYSAINLRSAVHKTNQLRVKKMGLLNSTKLK